MLEHSPEQKGRVNPLTKLAGAGFRLITGVGFNELRDWRATEARSRRYVDSLFDCYINGAISGTQLKDNLPPNIKPEAYEMLRLDRHTIFTQVFHRSVCLYLDGYLPSFDAASINARNIG